MANVSQLQPAISPQVQSISSEASEKDADFLALRLLNKRARLRLSPAPFDLASFPGKYTFFTIANSKGWFAAIARDASGTSALVLSPLANLRSVLVAASADDEQVYTPQRRVPIDGAAPYFLSFACNDTRILLGFIDGSIRVYASDPLLSSGEGPVQPVHVFAISSSAPLLSIQPNPGDIPELVAVLRDCTNSPGALAVELLDVQKLSSSGGWMAGKSPSTTPTSISWSPKGKQLALGLQSGDIVTFTPSATATPKSCIPHPPSANNMSVISVHWLSTSSFHSIYAPPGQLAPDVEQVHFHATLDSKNNSAQDIKFNSPYLPFPGLRPPGEFLVCLRGWDPSKVLLFIGDSTSSDIGLIGSVADNSGERWHNLALEETSTPSLPLDKDQNDTILLGLDVDLTSSESFHHSTASGEALELPAHPIMFAYASDGTILGWHVLNVTGTPYPGMIAAPSAPISTLTVPSVPSSIVRESSSDMQTTPIISPTTSAPAEAPAIKPPTTVFSQPSAFGSQSSPFGQLSGFGQTQSAFSQEPTPVFGKTSSFGQSQAPAFGSTSTPSFFGQSSSPAFGSAAPGVGFGAFSSAGPAKFGQPTFGFGGPPEAKPAVPPSASVPEESMAADDAPSLGGLGLGGPTSQDADSKPSIFGKASVPVSSDQRSTDGGMIKPGTGFGAFSGFDQASPFAKPSAFSSGTQQPSAAFGVTAFQSKTETAPSTTSFGASPSFGAVQPTFGQAAPTSTFGQPAFGQSSFGQFQAGASGFGRPSLATTTSAAPAATPSVINTTGAFSAFASGTQSAFGAAAAKSGPSAKPVWSTGDSFKPAEPSPSGVATNVLGKPVEPYEPKAPSAIPPITARDSVVGDDDSRSPSPALFQSKTTTSTVFSSSGPGPSTGAFSNLQTTPSAFIKPASGSFGELPKDSPFFTPKQPESKSVSAFALSITSGTPTSTPPKSSFTQPTFGASSVPSGGPKSAFPTVSAVQPTSDPISGGFGAFSSGSSGFAAFSSGGNKSFSELLRSAAPEDKTSRAEPPEATPTKPTQAAPQTPVSTTPTSTPAKEPPEPPSATSETPKREEEGQETVEVAASEVSTTPKERITATIPVLEPSLESISSSTSSSFVKVSAEEEGEVAEEEETAELELPSEESEAEESDTPEEESDSFEGDEESDGSEEVESEAAEEEESEALSEPADKEEARELVQKEAKPTEVPLPLTPESTRSPSTTPKAEHPKITVSESTPPQTPSPPSVPRVSPVRDLGTITPGSPKDTLPVAAQIPAPTPKTSPPPTSPFGLAPRANNRPIRSSPLASTSIVLEGEAGGPPSVSKSAPPAPVAQPAVPKAPFGQWTPPPPVQPTDVDLTRPRTSPALPFFHPPAERPAPASFTPTSTPPPAPSVFTLPDKTAPTTVALATTPGPSLSPFSSASITPSTVTPSGWGTPSKLSEVALPTARSTQTFFGGQPSPFGTKMGPLSSSPSPFASPIGTTVPSPSATPPLPKPPVPAPTPTPPPEQGMQAECASLLTSLAEELENLRQFATEASIRMGELKKTSGVTHQKADLGDARKWTFGDIEAYGRVLVEVQVDVKELKLQRVSLRKVLRELDSNMLKINTRREEIARFNRAKTDAEFAKMLKIRTLAPEYSETQSQLRKSIRAIRDRVQKLEDHLQASKKRIDELRTGRPSIRPPSLDTVNRTFRNIDIAIDQRKQEMSHLRHRMARLDISGGVGTRDQLAISLSKRPLNVTPNVAITTAAALNAERSAQKLKRAMLAARKQPLLNTTATTSAVPMSFQTPQKSISTKQEAKTPDGVFTLPTTPMSFPSLMPDWTPPPPPPPSEFESPGSHDVTPSRSRGVSKHHQKPIVLKKNASPGGVAQPSPFEWQPVEPIKPVSSLPFALRPAGSS